MISPERRVEIIHGLYNAQDRLASVIATLDRLADISPELALQINAIEGQDYLDGIQKELVKLFDGWVVP